ncbi:MAG: tetratricopeptide repeat protein [Roseinatronobacter sp.]
MRYLLVASLVWGLSGPGVQAQTDSLGQLRAELGVVSGQVAELAAQMSSGAVPVPQALSGEAFDQIERLRAQITALTARTEALEFQLRRVIDEASNRIGDMEFRLTELEGGDVSALGAPRPLGGVLPAPAANAPALPQAGAEAPQLAAGEQAAFDTARAQLEGGDVAGGIAAMDMFLQTYPGTPLGAQASALLARAQSSTGQDSDAARTWLNLYLSAPEGDSAPLALLELGEALGRLQQVAEACVMFDELLMRFPTAPQTEAAFAAKARLTCQ